MLICQNMISLPLQHYITKEGVKLYDDSLFINGTFVTLRVNTNKINDIYKYTKRRIVKKLK